MPKLTSTRARGSAGAMLALGLVVTLASCGWQAHWNCDSSGSATNPPGARSAAKDATDTVTYFGAEFAVEQGAMKDVPIEPVVQAF